MPKDIITLLVLLVMAILFVTDRVPLALTSMAGAVLLVALGILPLENLYTAFSGSTIVLVVAMMIIGSSLFHTGLAETMANAIVKVTGTSESGLLIAIFAVATIISSVTSGVAVVAMMLPIVIGMSLKAKVSVSRQLIPLAFAASLGGNLTLLGAASNVVVSGQMEILGLEPLSFLGIGKVGLPLAIIATVFFLTFGKRFLVNEDNSDQEYLMHYIGKSNTEETTTLNKPKAILSVIILIAVFVAMAFDVPGFPMHFVATIGAIIMVATGCISEKAAFESIDISTVLIVGGMSAVSKAMDISGAGKLIADTALRMLGSNPNKIVLLAIIFILVVLFTNVMMNTTTALLVTPIFMPIAIEFGLNPQAVGIAICIAASSPFLTPVGSGTNTLIVKPGNLKFMDFFKPGILLTVVTTITSLILIPIFFPL